MAKRTFISCAAYKCPWLGDTKITQTDQMQNQIRMVRACWEAMLIMFEAIQSYQRKCFHDVCFFFFLALLRPFNQKYLPPAPKEKEHLGKLFGSLGRCDGRLVVAKHKLCSAPLCSRHFLQGQGREDLSWQSCSPN